MDDRHFGYNIELPTKDTASRTLLVMRAESWWDQRWSASIMLKRTSFCYISIENGNDGGARKLKGVVGVIGKEFGRALDLRQRVKRPPVKVVEIIKPGNSVTART